MPLVYDFRKRRAIKKRGRRKQKPEPKGKQATLEEGEKVV